MPHIYAKIRESVGCTLVTTKSESFGNTFIESMVCGVPVVASKMMPVTELVQQGKTGLLYRGQNVDDAGKQIQTLLNDSELHQKMSTAAITHVQENFSIQTVAKQYVELLRRLVQTIVNDSEVNPND